LAFGPTFVIFRLIIKTDNMKKLVAVYVVVVILAVVGEIKCIIKAVCCNWEPIGKAEVVYTASALTGLGCIVGWIDIQDK
jgi:hypothetical protein